MIAMATALPLPVATPLIRMGSNWIKHEASQPTGSIKYRMVHAKLQAAIERGHIDSRTTLIEITSGSTGLALAYAGRLLGLSVELHAYRSASPAKLEAIRGLGARLVLYETTTPMDQILDVVARQVKNGRAWHLDQYDRNSIRRAYAPLARELVHQLQNEPPPLRFVSAVGTGGILQGVGSVLRQAFPEVSLVAVEPEIGTAIDGTRNTQAMYLGERDPYDRAFPDDRVTVARPESRAVLNDKRLGESATAVYELVRRRNWERTVMIAAD